jgi:hypothetical protein
MKNAAVYSIVILSAVSACTTTPPPSAAPQAPAVSAAPRPASELVDHAGDSTDTAVSVPADAPDGGVTFENNWIYDRIGRFRRLSHGTGVLNGRRYDVIEVENPAGDKHKFFFDITENWNAWKP